ncbi:MAG: hypothetical protein AAGK14_04665 [Verrucomicrobiota bacterium]
MEKRDRSEGEKAAVRQYLILMLVLIAAFLGSLVFLYSSGLMESEIGWLIVVADLLAIIVLAFVFHHSIVGRAKK